ncbi:FG-GAP-like repeat-containing protein (plasmid) [Tundrisphaera lichenicola]|uniref:FG-GAP-like repeat-containing protein n=1 Tax=Tundrisphaera lichenicola TaxID=2029860 RepID=UPI003EB97477
MFVPMNRRAALIGLAIALGLALVGWGVARAVDEWRFSSELERASGEMSSGRLEAARDRLARLSERWPGRDKVEYRLGLCESTLGHADAAIEAWGKVPTDSPLSVRTRLSRGKLALERGKLAEAESSLTGLERRVDAVGYEAGRLMEQVLLFSGRGREIASRLRRRWSVDRDPVAILKALWLLDSQPMPIGPIRERLDQMERDSPEDDRVWLGRADLAIRLGEFEEADRWLDRSEKRRPDDPDVWRARLDWALASRRPDEAGRALPHLPASGFSKAEVAEIRARLAALEGDDHAERKALEARVEAEPGDVSAWGRLADLAALEGQADLVSRYRTRKGELDRARDEYEKLMGEVTPENSSMADELARTAETLGREFEARSWWQLRARQVPNDPEARSALARPAPPESTPSGIAGQTLADLIQVRPPVVGSLPPAPSKPVPTFRDDAEASGMIFTYENDQTPLRRLPETMGGGVGLIDFDGDGWLDVYCVQGGKFPGGSESPGGGDRLFRNRGDATFEDVTNGAGLATTRRGFGHGVTVADYDNDGHPDLFVTRFGSYALYRNKGDGTFEDVTDRAGLGGDRGWPTSAAFGDLDGDGDLDLFVCQYLRWDPKTSSPCPDPERPGAHLYCVPRAFEAEPDRLFRNDEGHFVDVSDEAGIVDKDGRGLGVVLVDLDDDGHLDIYVANDMTANFLYRNLGGLRFEEVGLASGAGASGEGGYQAGMGVACGDVDGDGRPDLAVTNFYGESTSLFQNVGGCSFGDRTGPSGLLIPSRHVLGFGTAFLDADDDGRIDLATANGHVNDFRPNIPYAMPAQLYLGEEGGKFSELSREAGDCWSSLRVGRGLALGDLDNDGRQDLLILAQAGPLAFFRNLGTGPGSKTASLTIRLEGTKSNRDGIGTRVQVTSGRKSQTGWRLGGSSFLSANDPRLHFGLGSGPEDSTSEVKVHWPSGTIEVHRGLKRGGGYRIVEGHPTPEPLKGWPATP